MTLVAMATVQGPSDEGPTQAGQRDGAEPPQQLRNSGAPAGLGTTAPRVLHFPPGQAKGAAWLPF